MTTEKGYREFTDVFEPLSIVYQKFEVWNQKFNCFKNKKYCSNGNFQKIEASINLL